MFVTHVSKGPKRNGSGQRNFLFGVEWGKESVARDNLPHEFELNVTNFAPSSGVFTEHIVDLVVYKDLYSRWGYRNIAQKVDITQTLS